MNYDEFLKTKLFKHEKKIIDYEESKMNHNLFDFQKFILKKCLLNGKFAIFADCGLGKTIIQLDWARIISHKTSKKVLILAPNFVVNQTLEEADKFEIYVRYQSIKNSSKMF